MSAPSDLDLARFIREGDCVAWTAASAEPADLLERLNAALPSLPPCSGLANISLAATLDAEQVRGRMRIRAFGGAVTNRRFQAAGALDVIPAHYGALPDLVRDGHIRIDVALVMLGPGAAGGWTFGPLVDYMADALPKARVVIAEVNDRAPEIFGDTAVSAGDIDHVVHVSRPLLEARFGRGGAVERAIAGHIARLVPDGATIETGIGTLPEVVLGALSGKRDLGIHSGTIADSVVDLMQAGVVTNRRKPIDTGITVTAGVLGTERLYRFAHRNPALHVRSPRYTHDNRVHAQIPNLIGINSAVEVDLTGQVNAEVAGGQSVGMVGGHGDFSRGCLRSPGGRGIIALESTARGGKVSRIVARLTDGIVTTSRSDVDIVATEHGIAELRGRSVSERARALIAIAHPEFRRTLEQAAEGLV